MSPYAEPGELIDLSAQRERRKEQYLLLLDLLAEIVKREDVPADLLTWARRILRHA